MSFTIDYSDGVLRIDLSEMPSGERYEDRYGHYMGMFRAIATASPHREVVVTQPPASWVPLLSYLKVRCVGYQCYFEHDPLVAAALQLKPDCHTTHDILRDRTTLEVLCGFRPETSDALWKIDMQSEWWPRRGRVIEFEPRDSFIVTSNGSFHRPEVKTFMGYLDNYRPSKSKVVLVPCAADKPYPAPLHRAVLSLLPDDWYIANATGVLGIVPHDLWHVMPHYDSGIPNEWRLKNIASEYFTRHHHDRIVCYTDFYNSALWTALQEAHCIQNAVFVNEVQFYHDYLDLLDVLHLSALWSFLYPDHPEQQLAREANIRGEVYVPTQVAAALNEAHKGSCEVLK